MESPVDQSSYGFKTLILMIGVYDVKMKDSGHDISGLDLLLEHWGSGQCVRPNRVS